MARWLLPLVFSLAIVTGGSSPLLAADIRLFISSTDAFRAVIIEGDIEPGDFERFIGILRANQGKVREVAVFSPGGDFHEAMKIGRAMRALQLASRVPERSLLGQPLCAEAGIKPDNPQNCTCASAGFFIHIGGVQRAGSYLAVHRPAFRKGSFGRLSLNDARITFDALQNEAKSYMREMGVPEYVQEDILGTPSEQALLLDDKTVRTYFSGALPYMHEWQRNRCAKLSAAETRQLENVSARLLRANSTSESQPTRIELDSYAFLRKKQEEEKVCIAEVEQQSRRVAYERYFGIRPSDLRNYDFSRWSAAAGYLGRPFQDLLAEAHFARMRIWGANLLELDATETAPAMILSDNHLSPETVTRISLVSPIEPSPEFTRSLLRALESAWGKQAQGDQVAEWRWDKDTFDAVLTRETFATNGSFLNLIIEGEKKSGGD